MNPHPLTFTDVLVASMAGVLFGFALSLTTWVQPEVIIGFLQFKDWGLMLVMGGTVGLQGLCALVQPPSFGRPVSHASCQLESPDGHRFGDLGHWLRLVGRLPRSALVALGTGNTVITWAVGAIVLRGLGQGLTTRD